MPAALSPSELRTRRRQRLRRRRRVRFLSLLVLLIVAVGAYTVMFLESRIAAPVPEADLLVAEESSDAAPVDGSGVMHPWFARLLDRNLALPIAAQDVTIIAYHSVGDERAVPFEPIGTQINSSVVSRGIERFFSGSSPIRYYILKGQGRVVAKTGSVDVGAAPGTPIVSPVSGTVAAVKSYKLYGKYDDVQIDIEPDDMGDVTLTLLFVDEPTVKMGQVVEAGKTRLGKVREPAGDLGATLSEHTHDSGGHVHMQATRNPVRG